MYRVIKKERNTAKKSAVFLFYFQLFTKRIFYVMIKKIEKIEVEMIGVYEKGTTGTELPYIGVP